MNKKLEETLLNNSGKHLGDLVGWSLRGVQSQKKVRDAIEAHDLEDDLELPKLSPTSAYRRAVKSVVVGGQIDEKKFDLIKIEESEELIVHAIVERTIVSATGDNLSQKDAEFDSVLRIGFDKQGYKDGKAAEDLLVVGDGDTKMADEIRVRYEALGCQYLPADVRIAFQRAFGKWGGIRLLDHGGLWWVPSPNSEKVRQWKDTMVELGNTAVVIPIFDTSETVESLKQQSAETMEEQFEEIMASLQVYCSKEGTRFSTLEKRIDDFDELRSKIELHNSVLGFRQDELLKKLNDAQASLLKTIQENQ